MKFWQDLNNPLEIRQGLRVSDGRQQIGIVDLIDGIESVFFISDVLLVVIEFFFLC